MQKLFGYLLIYLIGSTVFGQNLTNFQFYQKNGKKVNVEKVAKELAKYDVVLFGEHHNDAVNHWLQLKITEKIYEQNKNIHLGMEMFERDNQTYLTNYVLNGLDEKQFKDSVRFWNNYKTDYQPLIEFAKKNKLAAIATNVPRKYASKVAKESLKSLDDLSADEKKWIVKLPLTVDYEAPGYPEMIEMMGEHSGMKAKQFVDAQALKDATMSESILRNLPKNGIFIHYNGDYHSKNYGGIYWYLKNTNPNLKVAVISILESDEDLKMTLPKEEKFVPTEFILVLPKDSPKTF